jgi:hypothetical protein
MATTRKSIVLKTNWESCELGYVLYIVCRNNMKQQSATKRQWISGVASVGVLVQHIAGGTYAPAAGAGGIVVVVGDAAVVCTGAQDEAGGGFWFCWLVG